MGIFGAYDPVVESILLEWEVETLRLPEPVEPGTGTRYAPEPGAAGVGRTAGDRAGGEGGRAVAAAILNRSMRHSERTREISLYKDRSLTVLI